MFRVKLELKKGAAKLQETDPKQANRRFWIGMVVFFCLPNRFTLCDDKLYQTWLCDALWVSFRLIN